MQEVTENDNLASQNIAASQSGEASQKGQGLMTERESPTADQGRNASEGLDAGTGRSQRQAEGEAGGKGVAKAKVKRSSHRQATLRQVITVKPLLCGTLDHPWSLSLQAIRQALGLHPCS